MNKKKKKILGQVKFQIKAQQATPAPPVGPQVGQFGINIMAFCKEFNEHTKIHPIGAPVPLILTVYQDKSFSFITKTLPTSYMLLQAASKQGKQLIIDMNSIVKIARSKMQDLTAHTEEAAIQTILGTAKSMQITIKEDDTA
jgi:large subunit ribosomal protein L11